MRLITLIVAIALSGASCFAIKTITLIDQEGKSFEAIIAHKNQDSVTVINLDGHDYTIPYSRLEKANASEIASKATKNKSIDEVRVELADAYYDGEGLRKNRAKAFELYMRSAKAGDAMAQTMVAFAYRDGEGVDSNVVKAVQWLEKAARNGNSYAQATLGSMYLKGQGVLKNYTQAKWRIEDAASKKSPYGLYLYGYMHYFGIGVKTNQSEGIKLLTSATNLGSESAKKLLTEITQKRVVAAARSRQIEAYDTTLVEVREKEVLILNNGIAVQISQLQTFLGFVSSLYGPRALLYSSGYNSWNLWLDGYGEYKVDILSVPNPVPRATRAEKVKIQSVLDDGSILKLMDGRVYEVTKGEVSVSLWIGYDDAILIENKTLLNLKKDKIIKVSLLR